jgi:hypothetical protein
MVHVYHGGHRRSGTGTGQAKPGPQAQAHLDEELLNVESNRLGRLHDIQVYDFLAVKNKPAWVWRIAQGWSPAFNTTQAEGTWTGREPREWCSPLEIRFQGQVILGGHDILREQHAALGLVGSL